MVTTIGIDPHKATHMPLSARTRRSIAVVDLVSVIGVVVGFGLLVVMWVIGEIGLALGAAGLVVAVLIGGSVARRLVWVSGRLEGDVLWLYGVHPRFAQEAGLSMACAFELSRTTRGPRADQRSWS